MPRRRLHGETQKRRQKKVVRTLKLRATVQRKQETGVPLPFERSPELDPEDVEFLEAMRDMRVRRLPGQGGAPVRQEAIQRAYFAADSDSDRLFEAAMRQMQVAPLGPDGKPVPALSPGASPGGQSPAGAEGSARETQAVERDEAPEPDAEPTRPAPPNPAPPQATQRPRATSGKLSASTPTRFDDSEDGARLMEEVMRSEVAGLNEKFEGAASEPGASGPGVRRNAKRKAVSRSKSEAEPDDQVDLHGKTQEEAIRMVQHFLLTAKTKRLRQVLIITGKGLNSGTQGPVLRGAVQAWLERHGAPYLRRFSWAPARLGGDGAIWVELW